MHSILCSVLSVFHSKNSNDVRVFYFKPLKNVRGRLKLTDRLGSNFLL